MKKIAKKGTKKSEELILKINRTAANALGITEETDVNMVIMDDMLIIKAKTKTKLNRLHDTNNRLMDQYESVLKKLAKT